MLLGYTYLSFEAKKRIIPPRLQIYCYRSLGGLKLQVLTKTDQSRGFNTQLGGIPVDFPKDAPDIRAVTQGKRFLENQYQFD